MIYFFIAAKEDVKQILPYKVRQCVTLTGHAVFVCVFFNDLIKLFVCMGCFIQSCLGVLDILGSLKHIIMVLCLCSLRHSVLTGVQPVRL